MPGLGWPAALTLGAIVAPTDALAATTVFRRLGVPRTVVTIVEGEALFNDATGAHPVPERGRRDASPAGSCSRVR